jgi:hypothetical protein
MDIIRAPDLNQLKDVYPLILNRQYDPSSHPLYKTFYVLFILYKQTSMCQFPSERKTAFCVFVVQAKNPPNVRPSAFCRQQNEHCCFNTEVYSDIRLNSVLSKRFWRTLCNLRPSRCWTESF